MDLDNKLARLEVMAEKLISEAYQNKLADKAYSISSRLGEFWEKNDEKGYINGHTYEDENLFIASQGNDSYEIEVMTKEGEVVFAFSGSKIKIGEDSGFNFAPRRFSEAGIKVYKPSDDWIEHLNDLYGKIIVKDSVVTDKAARILELEKNFRL